MQHQLARDLALHRRALLGKFQIGQLYPKRGIGELVHLEGLAEVAVAEADAGIDRRQPHLEEERGSLLRERDLRALSLDAQPTRTAGENGDFACPLQRHCLWSGRRDQEERGEQTTRSHGSCLPGRGYCTAGSTLNHWPRPGGKVSPRSSPGTLSSAK